jgi:hypothetical protein
MHSSVVKFFAGIGFSRYFCNTKGVIAHEYEIQTLFDDVSTWYIRPILLKSVKNL